MLDKHNYTVVSVRELTFFFSLSFFSLLMFVRMVGSIVVIQQHRTKKNLVNKNNKPQVNMYFLILLLHRTIFSKYQNKICKRRREKHVLCLSVYE